MAAAKASPTDLLWAYKLKTEHQHLLGRLLALETAKRDQDVRLDSVEDNAVAANASEIADLTKQVKALQDGGGTIKQIVALERRLEERMEGVEAGSEAVCLKVEEVEKAAIKRAEYEKKANEAKEKAMVKRVEAVEGVVREMGAKAQEMVRRFDDVEVAVQHAEEGVREVTGVLETQGEQIETVAGRVSIIEVGSEGMQEAITRIKAEQRELAALIDEHGRLQRLAIMSPGAASSRPINPGDTPENSLARDRPGPQPESAKESRKATEATRAAARELASLLEDAPLAATAKQARATVTRRPPVRRGKGWTEVERTPSVEVAPPTEVEATQQPAEAAEKRRPGRPAKAGTKRKAAELEADVEVVTQLEMNSQPVFTQRQTRSQAAKQTTAALIALGPVVAAIRTKQPPKRKPASEKAATRKRKGRVIAPAPTTATAVSRTESIALYPDAIPSSPPPTQPRLQTQTQSQKLLSSPLSLPPNPPSSPSPPQRQNTAAIVESEAGKGRGRPKITEKSASRREIVQSDDWEEFERQCEGI
ncbi:hypothetical protein B0A48_16016 [Cryoendolithus antarcticus]|uniref:Uncharacterized protein n=1 Tax=Cryoendolithus antarcticus TaxID=1507870 RepID=A0A1V8SEX3_9PEZI|nr:hypothetical protein B0A48_16016 [Cryoendolithus antarcticus]